MQWEEMPEEMPEQVLRQLEQLEISARREISERTSSQMVRRPPKLECDTLTEYILQDNIYGGTEGPDARVGCSVPENKVVLNCAVFAPSFQHCAARNLLNRRL